MDTSMIIRFYFESGIKKHKKFRESLWYKAIFEALREKNSSLDESIIALEINSFIKANYSQLFQEVEEDDTRLGKKVGSRLSQLRNWGIFVSSDLEQKGIRQKSFRLNQDYRDYLVKNINRVFFSSDHKN